MRPAHSLVLGATCTVDGRPVSAAHCMPAHHLTMHGVVLGMTGSGKTGLLHVMVEEALSAGIPVLMIDVKGDLPNLLLSFPNFSPESMEPWVRGAMSPLDTRSTHEVAGIAAAEREAALKPWGIGLPELQEYAGRADFRVITPGSTAGELLHMLSSLERRSERWDKDPEAARAALSTAVSLLLRILGRDHDPAKSKEHVLLSILAERRLMAGESADLAALLSDVEQPPITHVGSLTVDRYLPRSERRALAAALNTLQASPTFATWRQGVTLDIAEWLRPRNGRTMGTIISVAHLDDEERKLVLGVLLEEILTWTRGLPGTQKLTALIVFDEVFGFLPPHPANPPTKRPLVALMKQARAFGVGVVLATQNPMDLDYRSLGNAGLWCVGRLQTDADRARVVEGLASSEAQGGYSAAELTNVIKTLGPRWFLMRDTKAGEGALLLHPRQAMSFMRGPMTRTEVQLARGAAKEREAAE